MVSLIDEREFNKELIVNDVVEAMFQISKSTKTIGNVTNICSDDY